jgi:hypothetical protein
MFEELINVQAEHFGIEMMCVLSETKADQQAIIIGMSLAGEPKGYEGAAGAVQ